MLAAKDLSAVAASSGYSPSNVTWGLCYRLE